MDCQQKYIVGQFLEQGNWSGLLEQAQHNRSIVRILLSFLHSDNSLLRWRSIDALGRICARKAAKDIDKVHQIIRRLFWGMNDESGNFIASAPEAIAEILAHVPVLIELYAPILLSHIEIEPFPRGVHWAIARLSALKPQIFSEISPHLKKSLRSEDDFIRGCSVIALINIGDFETDEWSAKLLKDEAEFEIYNHEKGNFQRMMIAETCLKMQHNR